MRKVSAVFLDRDGVINKKAKEHDYVKKWEEFSFLPEVDKAIKKLNDKGIPIIIITNQRGIARGLFTVKDLENIHNNMKNELKKKEAYITAIYFCPHNYKDHCDCRKPKIGMLKMAENDYNLRLKDCYFIGDSKTDIETGAKAKCNTIFITDGCTNSEMWDYKPDYQAKNLYNAVKLILNN